MVFLTFRVQISLGEGVKEGSSLFEPLYDNFGCGELYPESFSCLDVCEIFVHDEVHEDFPDLHKRVLTLMGITARLYLELRVGILKNIIVLFHTLHTK